MKFEAVSMWCFFSLWLTCGISQRLGPNVQPDPRQERPNGRNQTGQPIGSPSDSVDHRYEVAYVAPYSSSGGYGSKGPHSRPHGLSGFPFAEYGYDPVDRGQQQETAYSPLPAYNNYRQRPYASGPPRQSFPEYGGGYEMGLELEYEAPYDYSYGRNAPYRGGHSSVPVQGYDAQASPYYGSQGRYYPGEYESYSQYRNDHDEFLPSPRFGFGAAEQEPYARHSALHQGLYDSPNVVPYNTHDYKKYPYGYSGSKSMRRSSSDSVSRLAEASNALVSLASGSRPVAYKPRFRQGAPLTESHRPTPGFGGDREFAAKPAIPANVPPVLASRPYDSLLPALLRSFYAAGGDGSYERYDRYDGMPRNMVLPFWASFFKS